MPHLRQVVVVPPQIAIYANAEEEAAPMGPDWNGGRSCVVGFIGHCGHGAGW